MGSIQCTGLALIPSFPGDWGLLQLRSHGSGYDQVSLTWDAPIYSGKDKLYSENDILYLFLDMASEQEEKALSAQPCVGVKDHNILAAPTSCCPILAGNLRVLSSWMFSELCYG